MLAILINSPSKIHLSIFSEYGYQIFDSHEIKGIMYIPIRTQSLDENGHRIGFSFEEICLNERLIIKIRDTVLYPKEIKLILRIK